MKKITLRSNILSHFLLLIIITATTLIGIQYFHSEKMSIEAASKEFSQLFKQLNQRSLALIQQSHGLLNLLEDNPVMDEAVRHDQVHPARNAFIKALNLHQKTYAIYLAHDNGDFFEVINMHYDPIIAQKLDAPQGARWGIIKLSYQDNHQTKRYTFLDQNLALIGTRSEATSYNPTARPWYLKALNQQGVVRSDPYMFAHLKSPGITFSKRIQQSNSVLAIDHTALQMARTMTHLKPTQDSDVFVFNGAGKKLLEAKRDTGSVTSQSISAPPIQFTQIEQDYIQKQVPLIVSNQLSWAPFDYVENGQPKGFSVEYMRLISAISGLKFEFTNDYTWQQILQQFQNKHIDIVHSIAYSEQRAQYGDFSESFHEISYFFITPKGAPKLSSYTDLYGKSLAIVKGWKLDQYLQQAFPEIQLKHYPDALSAIQAVENGVADAVVDTLETYSLFNKKYGLHELEINGLAPKIKGHNPQQLFLMTQPGQEVLQSILNKSIAHISQYEKKTMMQKWKIGDYAHPQVTNQADALFQQLKKRVANTPQNYIIELKHNGQRFLSMYSSFSLAGEDGYHLGIIVPFDTLLEPYLDKVKLSIYIAFMVAVLMLPLAFFASSLINRPIQALMRVNAKIKARRYDEIEPVDTIITEMQELSNSLTDLGHSVENYQQSQQDLLDSMIKLIAEAIDVKSPYTGAHCRRVPELAKMILHGINQDQSQLFGHFSMTDKDDLRAFELGAWLHDCGKITTPEYVVDKATKLETIYNRIHEIRTRFEVLWRDADITYFEACLNGEDESQAQQKRQQTQQRLQEEFAFIAEMNIGGEFTDQQKQQRICEIGQQTWQRHFDHRLGLSDIEKQRLTNTDITLPATEKLLDDKDEHRIERDGFDYQDYQNHGFKTPVPELLYNQGELTNLCIAKGTLSDEERFKINEHVMMSIKMLEKLPFPEGLEKVPTYAGSHHEALSGKGYPRQLNADDLSIPERVMVIADIFEALTSCDRPYKPSKTLSESLKIMSFMRNDNHIDADIFELFLRSGIYMQYAQAYLEPDQIDSVKIEDYLT